MPVKDDVWRAIYAKVAQLGTVEVKAGIVGADASTPAEGAAGYTLAQIGALHEFGEREWWESGGERGVPERSFIRRTFQDQRDKLRSVIVRLSRGVLTEKVTVEKAMDVLGTWAVSAIRATIRARINPPNKPATIKAKKSSVPLVDTGQLYQGISFEKTEATS